MPPIPPQPPSPDPLPARPRIILYQQTHHHLDLPISLLPLLTGAQQQPQCQSQQCQPPDPPLTHLILSAIHLNPHPSPLTLNDHPPTHPRFTQLWDEVLVLQDAGIKVMCMLGGAAGGSFSRLDYHPELELPFLAPPSPVMPGNGSGTRTLNSGIISSSSSTSNSGGGGGGDSKTTTTTPPPLLPTPANFDSHYIPLRNFIRTHHLDGIDLDVEEDMSLHGILHLIDRLRADFGPSTPTPTPTPTSSFSISTTSAPSSSSSSDSPPPPSSKGFIITLAPVATALIRGMPHLSGFDYFELDRLRPVSGGGRHGHAGVDWYNTQFYNGWASLDERFPVDVHPASRPEPGPGLGAAAGRGWGWGWGWYDRIVVEEGWDASRVVVGLLTHPRHGGSGYVGWEVVARVLGGLVERYEGFGGVMGWEYWGAVPELELELGDGDGDGEVKGVRGEAGTGTGTEEEEKEESSHYWRWAWRMRWVLAMKEIRDRALVVAAGRSLAGLNIPRKGG